MKRFAKILLLILVVIMIASCPIAVEAAVGGTFSNSKSISVNTSYKGNISQENDFDFYKFSLSKAGYINLTFSHKNLFDSSSYWCAVVFDSSSNEIASFSFSGSETSEKSYNLGLGKGTYYLRVSGAEVWSDYSHRFDKAQYTFKINYKADSTWENEKSNDSMSSANKIKTGTTYSGTVCDDEDNDYFKFTLSKPGLVTISFIHKNLLDSNEYFCCTLYNEKTSKIVSSGISGTETKSALPTIGLNAGTYYFRVTGGNWWSNYSHDYSNCNYFFKVNFTETTKCEKELNETFSSATKIAKGLNNYGSINSDEDVDFFKFSISSKNTLVIKLSHPSVKDSSEHWIVKLYNSKTDELESFAVSGTTGNFIRVKLPKGTYYVRVTGGEYWSDYAHTYSSVKYTLKVSVAFGAPAAFKATSPSSGSANLTWGSVPDAKGYEVYRYSNGSYVKIATTGSTSYKVSNLKGGTTYKFAVRAYKSSSGSISYAPFAYTSVKVTGIVRATP